MTVFGMAAPSSGGVAVGEILNLLEHYELRTGIGLAQLGETDYLHRFSEACATAFADRNRWVGDVADVPYAELLGDDGGTLDRVDGGRRDEDLPVAGQRDAIRALRGVDPPHKCVGRPLQRAGRPEIARVIRVSPRPSAFRWRR